MHETHTISASCSGVGKFERIIRKFLMHEMHTISASCSGVGKFERIIRKSLMHETHTISANQGLSEFAFGLQRRWRKWGVKCSEVKWNEVKIFVEMCVLSLMYSYVALCKFCVVHCLIICFSLLFSNYSTYVFLILFMFFPCFACFLFFCILCFCILLFIFLLLYVAAAFLLLYKITDHCHQVEN